MVIFKYEYDHNRSGYEKFCMEMPLNHEVLSVQIQNGRFCVWAKVDREQKESVFRKFLILGTGIDLSIFEQDMTYVCTFQQDWFVGHVFTYDDPTLLRPDHWKN